MLTELLDTILFLNIIFCFFLLLCCN